MALNSDKDCDEESVNSNTNCSTPKDSNMGGGKFDDYFEVDSLSVAATSKDCIQTSEDANATDICAESSPRGLLKGKSSRKRNSNSECSSYVPDTLLVETSNPSKRQRWIDGADQSNDENSCAKLETEASMSLAKPNLKGEVDKVNARLSDQQGNLPSSIGNSNVIGYPKAYEPSNWFQLNTNLTPVVELVRKQICKKLKESQKRERQWRKLLHMQLEEKLNLEKEIMIKEADFVKGYEIELLKFQECHELIEELLNYSNNEHLRRLGELKRKHYASLQDLETKHFEERKKFEDS